MKTNDHGSGPANSAWHAFKKHDYSRVAEVFARLSTPTEFADFLRQQLDPGDIVRSPLHELILETGFKGIFTTNYDRVFEEQGNPPAVVLRYPDCLSDPVSFREDGFFAKIHGCITRPYPQDLILTTSSFAALRKNEQYQTILRTYFAAYPVLTVGFSLADPAFRSVVDGLQQVFGLNAPPVFALMLHSDTAHRPKWLAANIDVIPFDRAAELRGFFKDLQQLAAQRNPPAVVWIRARPIGPKLTREVKSAAWDMFKRWRGDVQDGKSWSRKFGKVDLTKGTWRHLTRVRTPPFAVAHRLLLLPLARDVVENATSARKVRSLGPHRELLSVEGVYKSRYEADITVEVILEHWRPRRIVAASAKDQILDSPKLARPRRLRKRWSYAEEYRTRVLSFHEKTTPARRWKRGWDPLSVED